MTIEEKIELNKRIRNYDGSNTFVISIQKTLKSGKYLDRFDHNGKSIKILSDKQYESIKTCLD